jgi:hypothetical protein
MTEGKRINFLLRLDRIGWGEPIYLNEVALDPGLDRRLLQNAISAALLPGHEDFSEDTTAR